ncbi:MAG TPA: Bax inhibitor-1/YccA family protein [Candidatus Limnocylindrales bacterium]
MNDYRSPYAMPSQIGVRPNAQLSAGFLSQAFGWMFVGLLLTAGVSVLVQFDSRVAGVARDLFLPAILGQLVLVFAISLGINRFGATVALGLFFVYAASVGLTVGLVASAYTLPSVGAAFLSASAMFGGAAVYGATTKRSLASLGGYLFMGLIGLLVAMLVNLFIGSGPLGFVISAVGVVIFVGLTAYDTQRIAAGDLAARLGSMEKAAVIGALHLYLDFINLFLMLLRLFGDRR